MEISEIEKYIGECKSNCIPQSERAESLNIIQSVMLMRDCERNFCKLSYDEQVRRGIFVEDAYKRECQYTMEDNMAKCAIFLFRLANKYHMNVKSLKLEEETRNKNFEELVYSMVKISMTHYRIEKKIIILLGMLCSFCISEKIDLLWFVNKRLLINVK